MPIPIVAQRTENEHKRQLECMLLDYVDATVEIRRLENLLKLMENKKRRLSKSMHDELGLLRLDEYISEHMRGRQSREAPTEEQ